MKHLELTEILQDVGERSLLMTRINELTQLLYKQTPDRYIIKSFTNYPDLVSISIDVIVTKKISYNVGFFVRPGSVEICDYRGLQ